MLQLHYLLFAVVLQQHLAYRGREALVTFAVHLGLDEAIEHQRHGFLFRLGGDEVARHLVAVLEIVRHGGVLPDVDGPEAVVPPGDEAGPLLRRQVGVLLCQPLQPLHPVVGRERRAGEP